MLCSSFVCAGMISQIIIVIQKLRHLDNVFRDKLRNIRDHMTK